MSFAISDWVQGRTKDGELIQGFITSMNDKQNISSVYVVQSDHDVAVGTTVAVLNSWIKEQPAMQALDYEGPIRDFIEMALATRDEEWFEELTERLNEVVQPQTSSSNSTSILHNRNSHGRILR